MQQGGLFRALAKARQLGSAEVLKRLLYRQPFELFQRAGLHVLPVHYESPVPDTRELRRTLGQWYRESSFDGVDFDLPGQFRFLEELSPYGKEAMSLPPHDEIKARGFGEGYGEVEAHMLHAVIREGKPSVVVEVGAGISTFYSATALRMNREETGEPARLFAIEPRVRPALRTVPDVEIVGTPVQRLDPAFFDRLGSGDILFIDSSHIVRLGGDVPYLYLEILPRLRPGVLVHIHDIPFPYPSAAPSEWIFRKHRFWTEAYLVHAFLLYNSAFSVSLCSSLLHLRAPDELRSAFPVYDPARHRPSSLWLRRVR